MADTDVYTAPQSGRSLEAPAALVAPWVAKFETGELLWRIFRVCLAQAGWGGRVILTFYIPLTIVAATLTLVTTSFQEPQLDSIVQRLSNIAFAILGFFAVPTFLFGVTEQLRTQTRPPFADCLRLGSRASGAFFAARFTSGFLKLMASLLFIVPGIFLTSRYALVDAIVVLKGEGSDAYRSSDRLIKGYTAQTCLVWFVLAFCTAGPFLAMVFAITAACLVASALFELPFIASQVLPTLMELGANPMLGIIELVFAVGSLTLYCSREWAGDEPPDFAMVIAIPKG